MTKKAILNNYKSNKDHIQYKDALDMYEEDEEIPDYLVEMIFGTYHLHNIINNKIKIMEY